MLNDSIINHLFPLSGLFYTNIFITATGDGQVPVNCGLLFYEALLANKVPAALHIFAKGDHGFPKEPAHSYWFSYCASWLSFNGWLGDPKDK